MQIEPRGEQDEQAGDQQYAEVLLEVQDLPYIDATHVGQPHAHYRHRQQPGLMNDLVGGDEDTQYGGQRRQVVQVFRQPLLAHDLPQ
ncbi:hypothetical protein D3C73_1168890 [compost metagenome]